MLVALLLGPLIGGDHLELLLAVQAAVGVLAGSAMLLALRRPGSGTGESVAIERGIARALWGRREIRILSGLAFLGFGVFVALSTWLQTLLHPPASRKRKPGRCWSGWSSRASSGARCCRHRSRAAVRSAGSCGRSCWSAASACAALAFVPGHRRQGGGAGGDGRAAAAGAAGDPDGRRGARRGRRRGPRGRSCGWPAISAVSSSRCSCRRSCTIRRRRSSRWRSSSRWPRRSRRG